MKSNQKDNWLVVGGVLCIIIIAFMMFVKPLFSGGNKGGGTEIVVVQPLEYDSTKDVTYEFIIFVDSLFTLEKANKESVKSIGDKSQWLINSTVSLTSLTVSNFEFFDDSPEVFCTVETILKKERFDNGMNIILTFYFLENQININHLKNTIQTGQLFDVKAQFGNRISYSEFQFPQYNFHFDGISIELKVKY